MGFTEVLSLLFKAEHPIPAMASSNIIVIVRILASFIDGANAKNNQLESKWALGIYILSIRSNSVTFALF